MALVKITFDASSVTAKMDADMNHFMASSQNGVCAWVLGRCLPSTSNNYISFQNGYVQVYGRRVYVESGTKISISLDGSAYGYVVIKFDLGNNAVTLEKKEASSNWPSLTQQDLMNGGLIYELPLCRYTKTTSSLTLDTSYDVPTIVAPLILANNAANRVDSNLRSAYGGKWQWMYSSRSGNTYKFNDITSLNSGDGVIGVYVGGCYITFKARAMSGSGGIVYYTYMGNHYQLSGQITSDGLYLEDSRGNEPKYVHVTN